jgi:sugar phosphate permease
MLWYCFLEIKEGMLVVREVLYVGKDEEMERGLRYRWIVWGVMVLSYVVVFFHRLAAGVVRNDLVEAFGLSGAAFGTLASLYFYAYMMMQIPVGLLVDSLGARITISVGTLIAGVGALFFGYAPTASVLFLGRFLVGIGVATVFVSILKVQSQWFREREFATLSGMTSLIGNGGGLLAQTPLALAVAFLTWRTTFAAIGVFSIFLAGVCYLFVRNSPQDMGFPSINESERKRNESSDKSIGGKTSLKEGFKQVVRVRHLWPVIFFFSFNQGASLSFTSAWGVAYMESVYGLPTTSASSYIAVILIGLMVGSLFSGWFSDRMGRRKWPMLFLASLNVATWAILVFYNGGQPPLAILKPLFFIMGFTATGYVVSWALAREVTPSNFTGIAISLMNTACFLSIGLFTTLLGKILDRYGNLLQGPLLFQRVLFPCFAAVLLSFVCALFVPETKGENIYR